MYVCERYLELYCDQRLLAQSDEMLLLEFLSRIVSDFGSGSSKSKIRPFFPNPAPAKFLARFGHMWQTLVQLQCVQLITYKTNEADLDRGRDQLTDRHNKV